jgi:hypothetical protein
VKLEETAPLARYVGAMLALMLVVSGVVRAEPVFSFDATPGKLPKTVVPISYSIELRPDAGSDRDLRRLQGPRAAGGCLDQGAQMMAPFARFLRSVA